MSKRMSDREYEIMLMLRKDADNFREGRMYFREHIDDKHRFIDETNGKITGTFNEMPDFAQKAISEHRNKPDMGNNQKMLSDDELADIKVRRAKFNAKKNKKVSKGTRNR